MTAGILASAVSFRKATTEKLSFVLLNQLDLALTLLAVSLGLSELNPLMRDLFRTPHYLLLVKVIVPILLAWLTPGKLLIPAIALLTFVVGWDIKELFVYLF